MTDTILGAICGGFLMLLIVVIIASAPSESNTITTKVIDDQLFGEETRWTLAVRHVGFMRDVPFYTFDECQKSATYIRTNTHETAECLPYRGFGPGILRYKAK